MFDMFVHEFLVFSSRQLLVVDSKRALWVVDLKKKKKKKARITQSIRLHACGYNVESYATFKWCKINRTLLLCYHFNDGYVESITRNFQSRTITINVGLDLHCDQS